VIRFLALKFRRMSFGMNFLLPRTKKMSYLYIELNLSKTYMILQLKISNGLTDTIVINMF
jgi:hypothetical protein